MGRWRGWLLGCVLAAALGDGGAQAADWPGFRGADGVQTVSVEDAKKLPTDFDGASGKGIKWKVKVELPGESSPIVVGGKVFVTGADVKRRVLYCLDGETGRVLWQRAVGKTEFPADLEKPPESGFAAPTPASDGKRVVAIFGNGDMAAFDLEGEELWKYSLGLPESFYGFAASPVVHGDRVIVQLDHGTDATEVQSLLVALDMATGKKIWETKREVHAGWSSPIVAKAALDYAKRSEYTPRSEETEATIKKRARELTDGEALQVVTQADPWVIGYRFDTGEEIWRAKCMGQDCATSPTANGGVVYVALKRASMAAIKMDGKGDVSKTVAWKNEDDIFPEVSSPVSNGKQVFLALDGGRVVSYDAASGKQNWELNCDTEYRSTPTLVGDQVWVFDRKGVLHRVATGEAKELGKANLAEKVDSQPAYVDGKMYVRGKNNVFCLSGK